MNRESIPALVSEAEAPSPMPGAGVAACAWLAGGLPLGVLMASASGEVGFGDAVGVVRDLGFARVGLEGVISTLLAQLFAVLPVGGRGLRASLVGMLALALASRSFFGLLRSALDRRGTGLVAPLLALFASSLWSLSPLARAEAERVGGPMPALALLLLGAVLAREAFEDAEPRVLAAAGIVFGMTLAESHAAGAGLALVFVGLALAQRRRSWQPEGWRLLVAGAGAFAFFGSLRWFWPASAPALPPLEAPGPSLDVGAPGLSTLLRAGESALSVELGGAALALAACGAVLAGSSARLRRAFWPWALPLAASALVVGCGRSATPPLFILLGSLAVMAFFPIALQLLVRWAWALPSPLGRPAAVLALTFAATLVLSRTDGALAERAPRRAAAAWAEGALGSLPAGSALVVESPTLAFRLLASRVLHGTRPDVVLVPAGLLTQSSLGRDLLDSAPSASPLLRQLWVNGAADEYSLSRLADERPVFVELDVGWDLRLLEHLRPEGLWLRFSPTALGASERRAAAVRTRATLRSRRELSGLDARAGDHEPALEADVRRAYGDALAQQALALAALGEREPARRLLSLSRRVDPGNPLAAELRARLAEHAQGRVAMSDLLE